MPEPDPADNPGAPADVLAERRQLIGLCIRMLGTMADAEDAVQETWVRWYRLAETEREAIQNPAAWRTRVAGRVCLDLLGSARARRELYVGEWLPEPVPAGSHLSGSGRVSADPLDRVSLDESVSTALLVVLESMTPAERVAFVLHDVFALPFPEIAEIVGRTPAAVRQLATAARRRVADGRRSSVSRERHDDVARAFGAAARGGDLQALTALLDPGVTLRSDGGGRVSAARNPVHGADNVVRFLLGLLAKNRQLRVEERYSADGLGYVTTLDGVVTGVLSLGIRDGRITDLWIMVNPEKLTSW